MTGECDWLAPEHPHTGVYWQMTGACVHEHVQTVSVCDGCRQTAGRMHTRGHLLCGECHATRPGGHRCPIGPLTVTPLTG